MAIDNDRTMTIDQNTDMTDEGGGQKLWRRYMRNRMALIGTVILAAITLVALFAPWIAPQCIYEQDLMRRFEPPSSENWLGTDQVGRDMFSRVIFGSRTSLVVGFSAAFTALVIGSLLGLFSGFFGGRFDDLIMRLVDVMMSFPGVLLAILIVSIIGPGTVNVVLAVAAWRIPIFARVVRSNVLSLKQMDFIEAANALGASTSRIVFRHLALNSLPPMFIYLSFSTATAILTAAALSFLGLGVQPPTPEWGLMVSVGRQFLRRAPHLIMVPGCAIFITVLSINFVGDGLRDVFDPKLKM